MVVGMRGGDKYGFLWAGCHFMSCCKVGRAGLGGSPRGCVSGRNRSRDWGLWEGSP